MAPRWSQLPLPIELSGGPVQEGQKVHLVIRPVCNQSVRTGYEDKGKNSGLCEEKTHGYGRRDYRRIGHIDHETVIASLSSLKRKGEVRATDSWPTKYVALPRKPVKVNNGQDFMDYVEKLNRVYQELKAENNRLRGELNECRRKLATLAQRIVRQNIYGND